MSRPTPQTHSATVRIVTNTQQQIIQPNPADDNDTMEESVGSILDMIVEQGQEGNPNNFIQMGELDQNNNRTNNN